MRKRRPAYAGVGPGGVVRDRDYNALGHPERGRCLRRVRRKSYTGSPRNWTFNEHLVDIYDGWNMIRELDAMGDDTTKKKQ